MTIEKVNSSLPTSTKIEQINDQVIELEGLIEKGRFDVNDIDSLYSGSGMPREFKRDIALGNTLSTYTGWTHVYAEDSYSIWKYAPTNYLYNAKNKIYLDNKVLENRGSADSETALVFDKVFLYTGTYADNTTEAGTATGTAFELMSATTDYLYLGYDSTFIGVAFDFDTRGSNYTILPEIYHTTVGWVGLTSTVDDLTDATDDFIMNGKVSWNLTGSGAGWAQTAINSQTLYWCRFKTTTTPVTVATANSIYPSDSVISILSLSGDEVIAEDWAFCSYNSSVYVTVRNKGASSYEGDYYITSSSSTTNKQNFFIYNHEYTADYKDSTYPQTGAIGITGKMGVGTLASTPRMYIKEEFAGSEVLRLETETTSDNPVYKVYQNRVTTTDATPTTIHSVELVDNSIYLIEAHVAARGTSTINTGAGYVRRGVYRTYAGSGATLVGSVQEDFTAEDNSAWNCTLITSTNTVSVQVTGAAATPITWHSIIFAMHLSS